MTTSPTPKTASPELNVSRADFARFSQHGAGGPLSVLDVIATQSHHHRRFAGPVGNSQSPTRASRAEAASVAM